jgi:hypothetical protein
MLDNKNKYIYLLLHYHWESHQTQPEIEKHTVLLGLFVKKRYLLLY